MRQFDTLSARLFVPKYVVARRKAARVNLVVAASILSVFLGIWILWVVDHRLRQRRSRMENMPVRLDFWEIKYEERGNYQIWHGVLLINGYRHRAIVVRFHNLIGHIYDQRPTTGLGKADYKVALLMLLAWTREQERTRDQLSLMEGAE